MRWPIVIVAAAAAPAAASPGEAPWDGAVFAGATAPHPTNIAANPAAMLLSTPGAHLFIGGTGVYHVHDVDRVIVEEDRSTTPGPTVHGSTMGAGGHLGAMWARPSGMIAALLAMPAPEETVAGRDALAYHTRGSRSRALDITVAAAYRLTSRISIGLAGSYGTRSSVLRFARDSALEAGHDPSRGVDSDCGGVRCGLENPAAEELWTIDLTRDWYSAKSWTSLDDLTLIGGLLLRLPGDLQVGLTYQRPWRLGRIERTGLARVVAAPRDGGTVWTGEASLFEKLPEVVRLGARSRARERWDLVGELRWRRLGGTGDDDVRLYGGNLADGDLPDVYPRPLGLRDVMAFDLGLEEIDEGQVVRFGGKIGADSGAVGVDQLSPRAPWARQLTAGAGVQLRLASRWVVQVAYGVGYQPPATVAPGAFDPVDRIECVDSGYDVALPACTTVRDGYGAPTAAGTYGRWSHSGRLSLRLELP